MTDRRQQIELAELIQKELDASLTDQEFLRFQALLRDDPAAVQYYVKTILSVSAFTSPSIIPFSDLPSRPLKPSVLDDSVCGRRWRKMKRPRRALRCPRRCRSRNLIPTVTHEKVLWSFQKSTIVSIFANVAAVLLVVLFVRFAPVRGNSFAQVLESYHAVIQGSNAGLQPGQFLDDKPLKLESGLLKIQMNDGSVVLLEGPAEIHLENDDLLFLIEGRLTACVSQAGDWVYRADAFGIDH